MKKSGKLDFFARKLPLSGLSHTSSLAQIPRPALSHSTFEVKRKLEEDRKAPLKSRAMPRNLSVANLTQPSDVLRPVYVKPETLPQTHRLSLDGNLGAAVYFQAQQAGQNTGGAGKVPSSGGSRGYNSPGLAASKDLHLSRSQLPSPDVRRPVGGSEPLPPINSPPGFSNKRKEASRQQQRRFPDPEPSLSHPLLRRAIAKFSFRTRTGSINGVPKPHNQDAFLIVPDFAGCKNQCLLGVYDGHGRN